MGVIMKSGLHLVAVDYTAYSKSVQIRSVSRSYVGEFGRGKTSSSKTFHAVLAMCKTNKLWIKNQEEKDTN